MPRKGSGQKIQTAKGQAYGEAQMQEEAQRQMPLPQMPSAAKASPGQSSLSRPTERPDQTKAFVRQLRMVAQRNGAM